MSLQLDRRAEELRLRVVRRALRHDSAPKHVAGSATFVDDMREPEGLLHIAVGGAPIAAGQLLGIDLDAVRAAPGVVAVLTAADIPGQERRRAGAARRSGVRRRTDRVSTARSCSRWWRRRASRRAAPSSSPRSRSRSARTACRSTTRSRPTRTSCPTTPSARTTAPPRSRRAPNRVKGRLRIGGQEHFYLEGQVSLAIPGEDGDMLVHTSTQHPSEMQHLIAHSAQRAGRRLSPSRCAAWAARSAARRRRPRNGPRSRRSARASPAGRARSGSIATTT